MLEQAVLEISKRNNVFRLQYKADIVAKIRDRYTLEDELAIGRRRYERPEEFKAMNEYIEWCISSTKAEYQELGYNIEETNENE